MPRLSGPLKMNLSSPQIYLDLVRLFFQQANLSILPQFVRDGFHSFSARWDEFDMSAQAIKRLLGLIGIMVF